MNHMHQHQIAKRIIRAVRFKVADLVRARFD